MAGAGHERKKRQRQPEQDFQRSLVRALHQILKPGAFVFAVPNGGKGSPVERAIMSGTGVVRGIPDLIVVFDGRAVALECKSAVGRLSDHQIKAQGDLQRAGVACATVRTLPDAINFLRHEGVPIRITEDL